MSQENQLTTQYKSPSNNLSIMKAGGLKEIWNVGSAFAQSQIVPKQYQNNIPNCVVAIEMANNMNVSPLTVMQNLDIIQGKPTWSSQYVISQINSSGRFSPLQWKINKTDRSLKGLNYQEHEWDNNAKKKIARDKKFTEDIKDIEFTAFATDIKSGETLESPTISLAMAIKEGWYTKLGSKWQTMPELMGRYRAAAFFGRLYCPEVIHGFQTKEEVVDAEYTVINETPEEKSNTIVQENANSVNIDIESSDDVQQNIDETVDTSTGEVTENQSDDSGNVQMEF